MYRIDNPLYRNCFKNLEQKLKICERKNDDITCKISELNCIIKENNNSNKFVQVMGLFVMIGYASYNKKQLEKKLKEIEDRLY